MRSRSAGAGNSADALSADAMRTLSLAADLFRRGIVSIRPQTTATASSIGIQTDCGALAEWGVRARSPV